MAGLCGRPLPPHEWGRVVAPIYRTRTLRLRVSPRGSALWALRALFRWTLEKDFWSPLLGLPRGVEVWAEIVGFFFFFFFNLFFFLIFIIYLLFIFGCVGSSFLCEGFL